MPAAPLPPDEDRRLQALRRLGVLDTPTEGRFDDLVRRAAEACGVPVAAVSLVDERRVWFKSVSGLPEGVREAPRDRAFCAYTVLEPDRALVVPDLASDPRFADNPLVSPSGLGLRFYAGMPLVGADGEGLGALCVMDTRPRALSESASAALRDLAREAGAELLSGVRCGFVHPFFAFLGRLGDGRFVLDGTTDRAVFAVRLHGCTSELKLPLEAMSSEFAFGAADAGMLRSVAEAVEYVDALALGDPLPPEVVTGAASWVTPPRHRVQARKDLRARLQDRAPSADADAPGFAIFSDALAELLYLRERVAAALALLRGGAKGAAATFRAASDTAGLARGLLDAADRAERRLAAAAEEAEEAGVGEAAVAFADSVAARVPLARRRNAFYREVRRLEVGAGPWRGVVPRADSATEALLLRSYRLLARRDLPGTRWPSAGCDSPSAPVPPSGARVAPPARREWAWVSVGRAASVLPRGGG